MLGAATAARKVCHGSSGSSHGVILAELTGSNAATVHQGCTAPLRRCLCGVLVAASSRQHCRSSSLASDLRCLIGRSTCSLRCLSPGVKVSKEAATAAATLASTAAATAAGGVPGVCSSSEEEKARPLEVHGVTGR